MNLNSLFIKLIIHLVVEMDRVEARLKANLQCGEVHRQSRTQNLKLYNMSPLFQKNIMWLPVGLYLVSLLTNILTFLSWIGVITNNHTAILH